jgi:hypothetical protein
VLILTLRLLFCYLIILAIALQSAVAIAEIGVTHTNMNQSIHASSHQDSDHHSQDELAITLTDNASHSDADHPDCHANHCHHSSLVYIDVAALLFFHRPLANHVIDKSFASSSFQISPDLRPPIV